MPFMLQDLGYGTLTSAVEALEECLYLCAFMAPTESLNPGYLHRVIDNAPLPFDECENVLLIHFPPLPPLTTSTITTRHRLFHPVMSNAERKSPRKELAGGTFEAAT